MYEDDLENKDNYKDDDDKNEADLKNEDYLKNENNIKNEDYLDIERMHMALYIFGFAVFLALTLYLYLLPRFYKLGMGPTLRCSRLLVITEVSMFSSTRNISSRINLFIKDYVFMREIYCQAQLKLQL